jgi:hypothetical protein
MTKEDLIREVTCRTGLTRREAARGIDAMLASIRLGLGSTEVIYIRGLGRLVLKSKKGGVLPAASDGSPPQPIPPGKAVKLVVSRRAVAKLNSKPHAETKPKTGGNMDNKHETSETQAAQTESSAVGLDIGTSRVVMASGSLEHIKTSAELNAFVTVPYSKFTENILKQNKVNYQLNGGDALQIYGNEAERFANFFNAEVRRPMLNGVLNPNEEYSFPVLQAIISNLVRKAKKGENLRFSVPGPLRDGGSNDLVYHEGMLKNLLCSMGYNAMPINEGLAVVFAELQEENFSGIGISCGGGMCNVALAFMSVPVMTFSIAKAGDYIDRCVASVTGELPTRIRVIKEEGLDLSRTPQNKYENALHIYYQDLILSLVESLRNALAETRNLPRIDRPIPIVLSGGTAKPKGFLKKFREAIERDGFPLEISQVRLAADPLAATARGCLIAALYDA